MTIEHELNAIEVAMLNGAKTVPKPVFVHMLGIPGSGKSSFLKILNAQWKSKVPVALLGFDQVMQDIPSYQAMDDKIAGFAKYEIPARMAGYRILDGLMAKQSHILFDNGGSAESHPDLLRHARDELGYRLAFVWTNTPLEVARARVDFRAVEEGQHTPLHYLEDRQAKLDKLITTYRTMTPHFYEMDNHHDGFDAFNIAAAERSVKITKDLGL